MASAGQQAVSSTTSTFRGSNNNVINSSGQQQQEEEREYLFHNRHIRDLSPDRIKKMTFNWSSKNDFLLAQAKIAVILIVAYLGNVWEPSYDRNKNHDMFTFWFMNILILIVGIFTLKHDATASSRGVQLLSRAQTEEWKGWMQWAFIMVSGRIELQYECSFFLEMLGLYCVRKNCS